MMHSEPSTKQEMSVKSSPTHTAMPLPGRKLKERITGLAVTVGSGAILLGIPYLTHARVPFIVLLLLFPFLVIVCIGGLRKAFGSTSLPERYRVRARRLAQSDTKQALADYAKALKLSENANRPAFCRSILEERAQIYKKLGQMDEAIKDLDLYVQSLKKTGGAGASVRIAGIEDEIQKLKNTTKQQVSP